MSYIQKYISPVVLLLCVASMPCLASSTAASSASDSASQMVGSVSTSLEKVSKSSTHAAGLAQGDFVITEVVAAAEHPDQVRLALHAVGDADQAEDLFLFLPKQSFHNAGLGLGRTITARQRSYGVEFFTAENQQAFYLVLKDAALTEFQSVPVVL